MRFPVIPVIVCAAVAAIWFTVGFYANSSTKVVRVSRPKAETIYILNHAQVYISDKQIRKDIRGWEVAANKQFAPVWHTEQVRLKLVSKAPSGSLTAVFKKDGPVQGALAYHYAPRGAPGIVVYAGTDDYYGYSNSVSFTHELFELLADPTISQTNQGWPYPYITIGKVQQPQLAGTVWFNEVCDPVEAYAYKLDGAKISDWITPNWFNDHVQGAYDHMHVIQAPLTVARGGYAQYWDGQTWNVVSNFKNAGRDANGFLKAEQGARS